MKRINIMLIKYSDWVSSLVYLAGGFGYTHVSIGLGEDPETYYSFNGKGFCEENLAKYRRHGVKKSFSYQLEVSDEAFEKLALCIEEFRQKREQYRYSALGALLCHLHIPVKWKDRYFCSQFVAEVLLRSGAVPMKKKPVLYLPNQFRMERMPQTQLRYIQYNPV